MPVKPNLAGPWIDVRSFVPSDKPRTGNPSDPDADWYQPIQDALDYLVNQPFNTDTGTLYLPPGVYRISKPLQFRLPIVLRQGGYTRDFCSVHLIGDAPGYGTGAFHGTVISTDFADGPALVIQSGRAVKIENLVLRGKNAWTLVHDPGDMATHYDDSNYVLSGVRDKRRSPHAGICIDPYHPAVPMDDRYPALTGEYDPPGGGALSVGGSSWVQISNCYIHDFAVGIAISLNGITQNAEDIAIVDCKILSTKSAIAVGQDQSRNLTCRNLSVSGARVVFDSIGYGKGDGNCPSIFGANIGGAKYIFQTYSWAGNAVVSGLYAEAFYSVGSLGGAAAPDALAFTGCAFNFAPTPAGMPVLDLRLANGSTAIFTGCNFIIDGPADEPMYIYSGSATFHHCFFGAPQQLSEAAPSLWNVAPPDFTSFTNCQVRMGPHGALFSTVMTVPWKVAMENNPILPGTLFYATAEAILDDPPNANPRNCDTDHALRWVSGNYPKVSIGAVSVTFNANGTATLTLPPSAVGLVAVGDFLTSSTPFYPLPPPGQNADVYLPIGKVTAVNGTAVTLSYVLKVVVDAMATQHTLTANYLPRIHNPVTGQVDLATSTTDVILPSPGYASQWQPYNRIRDKQGVIKEGTYVASVSGAVITLSRPLPAGTPATLDLYDADVRGLNTTRVI